MSRINFHEKVDDVSHFVVVIRVAKGNTIAFYSEPGLQKYIEEKESRGFLCSLTNQKNYFLKSDPDSIKKVRVFKYDPYYFVIGNEDLKILLHDEAGVITSNMGNRYSFFDYGGEKNPLKILGTEQKESKAESYEVYQLIFG